MDHGSCVICQKPLAGIMLIYRDREQNGYCSRVCRDEGEVRANRPRIKQQERKNMAIEADAAEVKAEEVKGPEPVASKGPEPVASKGPEPVASKGPKKAKNKGPKPVENKGPKPVENKGPKKSKNKGPRPTPNKKAAKKTAKKAGKGAAPGRKRGKVAPKKAGKGKTAGKPGKAAQKTGKQRPTPVMKKKVGPVRVHPYRAGSLFAHVFDKLLDGKPHGLIELFADWKKGVADPTRIIGHIMTRGADSGQWRVVREGGQVKMVKVWRKKAA